MKVGDMDMADRVAGAEGLDEKAAVLWRWDAEDLRQLLLFHPDLIRFSEPVDPGGAKLDLRRVVAVAGQPIQGGRDLLLSTAPIGADEDPDGADISLVVTTTEQDRQELEQQRLDRPCVKLDLYEPVRGPAVAQACEREPLAAITYAYIEGNSLSAVGTVLKAFRLAFGGEKGANLLILAREPASVRSIIDEYREESELGTIRVEHLVESGSILGRDAPFFDVLIVDDAPGRLRPLGYELAARGKEVVGVQFGGEAGELELRPSHLPEGGGASFGLATEMLRVARQLADGGKGAVQLSTPFARMLAPEKLARRLRWITQGPLGTIEGSDLRGVGWLTRWNVKCGIGDHAAHQIAEAAGRHVVLAAKEEPLLAEDGSNVFRCWTHGLSGNDLEEAAAVIYQERLASVMIHFNWAFYHPAELLQFVRSIKSAGRVVQMDVHSTRSEGAAHGQRLEHFAETFTLCDRVLVHQPADAERIRSIAPDARVAIEPLGITVRDVARASTTPAGAPRIACFGFCLPNKGIEELVLATWMLRQSQENVRLLLLNAEHPAPQSRKMVDEVRRLISKLELSDTVTFVTDYLDEAKCMDMLSETSLIVNPYQQTGESASAAARFALASTAPVLVTPLPIFDDLGRAVFRAGGTSPAELAKSVRATLAELKANSRAAADVREAASTWRKVHDVRVQTERIVGVAESIGRNRRAEDWLRVGAC